MESWNPGIMEMLLMSHQAHTAHRPHRQDRQKQFVEKIKKQKAKTGKTSYSSSLSFFSSPFFLLLRACSCSASRACCAAKAG